MYNVAALCKDVAAKREGVKSSGGPSANEYSEVWTAFGSYLKSCLEQRRGLHLHSFAKIGFVATPGRPGTAPEIRPYFQLTEQYCRAASMSPEMSRKHLKAPAGEVCPLEDFNFSKAAIKFSSGLNKDQVFSGMKSLVQRLAEAYAEGKDVQLAIGDVGKFSVRGDRDPKFEFSGEIHALNGSSPAPAASGDRTGGAAFRKDAPDTAFSLDVRGSAPGETMPVVVKPSRPITPAKSLTPARMASSPDLFGGGGGGYGGGGAMGGGGGGGGFMTPPDSPAGQSQSGNNLTNAQYKKEVAYKEAMDRHICAMEARAAEAIAERAAWGDHMEACLEQERDEINAKRTRAQMNLHFIKHQMCMGEDKKKSTRNEDIEAASAHGFPNFEVAESSGSHDFILGQQARMRSDLDDQVRTNNTLRNLHKQRERSIEVNQLQANREEMAMLRNAERAKKVYDREALATAWNSEIRMKNIWKAIDNHNKVGSQTSSHPPQVFNCDMPPPSRGGSVASAGRLMTGSSRRMPMGASSSLSKLEGLR